MCALKNAHISKQTNRRSEDWSVELLVKLFINSFENTQQDVLQDATCDRD